MNVKEGKQVFLLDDASINLLANCKNSISISGGLDGSVSIDSSALKLKGAKVAFDTPKLTLNAKGELESGIAKITLTMPEDTLGSLIKSQFNFPIAFREEIDFKLGRTGIRGDIFFKKPENGLKFDFDKKAIKVSCKPSVDGNTDLRFELANPQPFPKSQTFASVSVKSLMIKAKVAANAVMNTASL